MKTHGLLLGERYSALARAARLAAIAEESIPLPDYWPEHVRSTTGCSCSASNSTSHASTASAAPTNKSARASERRDAPAHHVWGADLTVLRRLALSQCLGGPSAASRVGRFVGACCSSWTTSREPSCTRGLCQAAERSDVVAALEHAVQATRRRAISSPTAARNFGCTSRFLRASQHPAGVRRGQVPRTFEGRHHSAPRAASKCSSWSRPSSSSTCERSAQPFLMLLAR
jgi:hypothetical protein